MKKKMEAVGKALPAPTQLAFRINSQARAVQFPTVGNIQPTMLQRIKADLMAGPIIPGATTFRAIC